ncbi:MAG: rhomboid family intramembrane serine protease [Balneolaceae bacterium]
MELTLIIIGINVLVSLAGLYSYPQLINTLMMIPYRTIREKTWYEIITSGFVHAGIGHLLFNMFTLFFFGPVLVGILGNAQFLLLYFSGLVASSLPSLIKHKNDPQYATLGASGAIESVLFAFIIVYPFEKIYLMLIPIGIPAFVFGIAFIAYSIYASKQEGRVNHEAHIAGGLWGIIFMLIFVPGILDHFLTTIGIK